jgi:sugar lactone lactonase YvrE
MRIEHPKVEHAIDFPIGLGEGPLWDGRQGALYFVDISAPALLRCDPTTREVARWAMPEPIGSFGLCPDGRAAVALKTGVHLFDFDTEQFELLAELETDQPENRLNDGKVGPDGAFWVGSFHDVATEKREPRAALYRIEISGKWSKIRDGLTCSNGLAWTRDGRTMFHADSPTGIVNKYAFDPATGAATNPRPFITLSMEDGRPDGAACDVEGYYWSAGVTAGCLNRIAPDGTIERRLMLPVVAPTMPCFGGPDMKTLYVTSLTRNAENRGTVLSLRVDVAGVPVGLFGERTK